MCRSQSLGNCETLNGSSGVTVHDMTATDLLGRGLAAAGASDEALSRLETAVGRGLPESYRRFLRVSNGCDTDVGALWVILYPAEDVPEQTVRHRESLQDPRLADTVFIGTDGAGEAYVIVYDGERPRFGAMRYIGDGPADLLYESDTLDGFISKIAAA